MKSVAYLAALSLGTMASPALAQQISASTGSSDPVDADRNSLTIGVGAAYMPSYEGSDDYALTPAGAARGKIDGFSFFTRDTHLLVDLIPNPSGPSVDFQLGPVVGVNVNRTGRLRDPQIKALGHRKLALEAGGYVGIGKTGLITSDYDNLSLRVSYVHDVGSVHHSYVITPSLSYTTPLSRKAFAGISASADYAGNGYAQTYFDVDAAGAARSGLPVFSGGKGWKDISFSALAGRSLTGDLLHGLGIYAVGSYSRLQNDFAASPVTRIAGSADQWVGAIGLGYTF